MLTIEMEGQVAGRGVEIWKSMRWAEGMISQGCLSGSNWEDAASQFCGPLRGQWTSSVATCASEIARSPLAAMMHGANNV